MAIAVTGMLALGGATTAHAQSLRAFEATAHQLTMVSSVCNGDVCEFVFEGRGTVNIMGPATVTVHVVQDFSGYPCDPYTSEATFVGGHWVHHNLRRGGMGLPKRYRIRPPRHDPGRFDRHRRHWRV